LNLRTVHHSVQGLPQLRKRIKLLLEVARALGDENQRVIIGKAPDHEMCHQVAQPAQQLDFL
jgi:hypothetical protein